MHQFGKTLFLVTVFVFSSYILLAQEQDKVQSQEYMALAKEMIDASQALDDIREIYVMAAEADTTNARANFEAGYFYIRTINKHMAVKFLQRVYRQQPSFRFDLEYWIAFSYQNGYEFDQAIKYYNLYKSRIQKNLNYPGKDKQSLNEVERRLEECNTGKELVSNKKPFSIINIGRAINSEYEDYSPVVNADESEMIFTSRRKNGNVNENVWDDNKPYEDIFFSTKTGGEWSPAKNIGTNINTKFNNSNLTLSPNGKILFIYDDVGNGDILFSERQPNGTWSPVQPLPGAINSTFEEYSASITNDEKTIYFSSERPGGLGRRDIYSASKDTKGAWNIIKNLGPAINTEFDEEGPFIDYDGKTLYFSSKGKNGMGGYDLYKTTQLNEQNNVWSEPENLGYPINTPDDDIFLTGTSKPNRFYYASVREDGSGYSDIYLITPMDKKPEEPIAKKTEEPVTKKVEEPVTKKVEEPVTKKEPVVAKETAKKKLNPQSFILKVVDDETNTPMNAKVRLRGKDNTTVAPGKSSNGTYEFSITTPSPKDYLLYVEADGYIFENLTISLKGASENPSTESRTVSLRKLKVGQVSILRNIYFDFGTATFKQQSYDELNKLLNMMQQNRAVKVEIGGHTDNVGNDLFNKQLSQRRANAVKTYLIKKGIAANRVTANGYGESKPLATNDDEVEGREINRRVEFKVTSN